MNVLFLSNLYPPNVVGGYERLCFDMASALAERSHGVSVLTSNYGGCVADYPGQRIDRSLRLLADERDIYRSFSATDAERREICAHNAAVLRRKLAEINPDVLFVWNLFFFDRSLLQEIQAAGCRTVFLLTDNWLISFLKPEFWQRYFTERILSSPSWTAIVRTVLKRLLTRAHGKDLRCRAVFPSRFMRGLYAQAGFRFQETVVIPHGVTLLPHEDKAYRDRMAPVENGRLKLLFAGRVVEMKGVHTILEALPEIFRGLPEMDVQLTVLGDCQDGQYLKQLNETLHRSGLDEKVEFLPPVLESDLFGLFQNYDIYIFPSLYEPFSLTLIHALESGIPVIASDVGGNNEIVFPGRTGLLFAKGNARSLARAVIDLAANPPLRCSVSMEARILARQFTFQTMIQKIEAYLWKT